MTLCVFVCICVCLCGGEREGTVGNKLDTKHFRHVLKSAYYYITQKHMSHKGKIAPKNTINIEELQPHDKHVYLFNVTQCTRMCLI